MREKAMSRIPATVLAAALTTLSFSAAQAGLVPARVADAVRARIAAGEYPALVIAIVDHGKVEIEGYGRLDDGAAPDAGTVFEIGSITKTFTATLLAEAVQSGEVTLDEPVAKLLPGFTVPSRGGKQITLEAIATQRSGLPRMPTNFAPADPHNPYADYDAARLKAFLASYTLPRDPGAQYEYSNLAFGLLGTALAGGGDYSTLLRDKILRPLGMTQSGTTLTAAMRAHLATGHDELGKPAANWDFDVLAGCGALRSTAHDMLLYLKANMGVDQTPLAAAMTLAHTPRADALPHMRIGLAWMTTDKGIVWHNGGTGGYRSFIGFTTDGTRGVVILTNTATSVDDLGFASLDDDAPLAPARNPVALGADALKAYPGVYRLAPGFDLRIFQIGDQLYGQATGQGAFAIFASAPDEFFAKDANISITFNRDAAGAVTGLVLHQNGDRAAPRLPDRPQVTLDAATLGSYVGKYQLTPNAVVAVALADGGLTVQLTGQPAFPIYASAPDKFFLKVVDASIDFEHGPDGKVDALVLHQGGKDLRAPRIAP
jgi:CubicO group peptidase (beta-lactamase class C family)